MSLSNMLKNQSSKSTPIKTFYTRMNRPPRLITVVPGESRTKTSFADECDINKIWAKALKAGGTLPQGRGPGVFADVSNLPDYATYLDKIRDADRAFMSLPSKVRREFDNNPQALIDFVRNPKNRDRAVELGLIKKPTAKAAPAASAEGGSLPEHPPKAKTGGTPPEKAPKPEA